MDPVYVTYNKHVDMDRWKEALFTDGKPRPVLLRRIRFSKMSFIHSILQKVACTENTHTPTNTLCEITLLVDFLQSCLISPFLS